MKVASCTPHQCAMKLEFITYDDAWRLQALLKKDIDQYRENFKPSEVERQCGRWKELIIALDLIATANKPAEIAVSMEKKLA